MVEFKRKKGENFESFLRRFNKKLQQSRKLKEVKERRYLSKKINKTAQKKRALVGRGLHEKREYLKKIGKWEDETRRKW